jgi:uncharacterized repeat protein (TIGR02543 family)
VNILAIKKLAVILGFIFAFSFIIDLDNSAHADSIQVHDISVSADGGVSSVEIGAPLKMCANVQPDDATITSVTWSVENGTGSAAIDSNGVLTGTAAGGITVIATANDGSGVYGEYTMNIMPFSGQGTSDDPYLISTADDLSELASLVNSGNPAYNAAYYKQTADIDLSGFGNWTPIGYLHNSGKAFAGTYDGNRHKVEGLTINIADSGNVYAGLFGLIASSGSIVNLSVDNCKISARTTENHMTAYVGGIAGWCSTGASISGCSCSGSVTALRTSIAAVAGGIAGENDGTITDCYNWSDVTGYEAGGMAGESINASVKNCYNVGICRGTYLGGIIGYSYGCTVDCCYSIGCSIGSGDSHEGGIIGLLGKSSVTNCFFLDNAVKDGMYALIPGTTELTDLQMKQEDSFTGFDFSSDWVLDSSDYPYPLLKNNHQTDFPADNTSEFDGGNGAAYSPYKISTKYQLDNVRNHLTSCFSLENDIHFLDSDYSSDGPFYHSEAYWIPIGSNTNPFSGVLDGNGHRIAGVKSMVISSATAYAGLFGFINTGLVKNLVLEGCDIYSTSSSGSSNAGGIAGELMYGLIYKCFTTGTIYSNQNSGGIVGTLMYGQIECCHNESDYHGNMSGGIAGTNNGYILMSYNNAYGNGSSCGGIAGFNTGNVYDCYNAKTISGGFAGGIVGQGYGYISRCYNISTINPSSSGGISGVSSGYTTNDYFIDTNSVGVGGGGTSGTVKCTDLQMQTKSTYSGFDFANTWMMDDPIPDDSYFKYPQLRQNPYRQIYPVTVDAGGCAWITGCATYGAGDTVTLTEKPYNPGYKFTGWEVTSGGISLPDPDSSTITFAMPSQPVSIIAHFTRVSYTVTFKDWDGTILKQQSVYYGDTAVAPSDPSRTGYSFTDWDTVFTDIACDLTVTAQYQIKSYTVTFRDYDGKVLSGQSVSYGGSATAPTVAVRSGYTFTGWDAAFNDIESDLTVTALYSINRYTISYVLNGGTVTASNPDTYTVNDTFTLNNPARTGYLFAGWSGPEIAGKSTFAAVYQGSTGDRTYTANWINNQPQTAYLAGIAYSAGKLDSGFSETHPNYTLLLGENDAGVTITPIPENDGATMTINGVAASSDYMSVTNGKSILMTIKVSYGTLSKTYKLTIKRPKSTDNNLASLTVSAGTLDFNASVTQYYVTIPEGTSKVTVAGAKDNSLATITNAKKTYTLKNNKTIHVTVKVRAQSGATKTYKITITRAPSTNANPLYIKAGSRLCPLVPAFNAGVTSYNVTLPANVSSVTITCKAADSLSHVTMDGVKRTLKTIRLARGQSITVKVIFIAQAGNTSQTYEVTISRS